MNIYQELGQQLEMLRGRQSQTEFAALIDLTQSYYARIEKGQNRLQIHQLAELAQKLNLTIMIANGKIEILSRTKTNI
jgi:transcriptional regulator with XRE-family HTH domain